MAKVEAVLGHDLFVADSLYRPDMLPLCADWIASRLTQCAVKLADAVEMLKMMAINAIQITMLEQCANSEYWRRRFSNLVDPLLISDSMSKLI